ncbi:MAG: Rne/Rng family ribonuclease [Proteobacteria bacterium]|nr:Rne/Rng family ribonuclease [Pseudomonadota bacterium]
MSTKRMLIDASHPEETRVVVLDGNKVEEFDFEAATKRPLKGNIYLAKVTRVEPSLQAAFVEYGGNRQGFLAFGEIHPDYYQIPIADRQALLAEQEAEARRRAEEEFEIVETGTAVVSDEELEAEHAAEEQAIEASAQQGAEPASSDEQPDEHRGKEPREDDEASERGFDSRASDTHGSAESEVESGFDVEQSADPAFDRENDRGEFERPSVEEIADEEAEEGIVDQQSAAETDHVPEHDEHTGNDLEHEHEDSTDVEFVAEEERAEGIVDQQSQAEDVHAADQPASQPLQARRPSQRWARRRHYKIQEVIKRRQIILVQVVKEERGNKGAALTTYISLAGRYCVLMPNTPRGGGISRKITNLNDRKRLKAAAAALELPEGMGLIIRTAGENRTKLEIKRDYEYLLRMWDQIRELTLQSNAPARVYEEGDLIKRAIRDLYNKDVSEIVVEGDDGYRNAKDFMRMLMPSHAKNVQPYKEPVPLFQRHHIEAQLDSMFSPTVTLRSGGYIVINQTEALVSIDVNSGRATREHSIEETAHKTNLEAAEEISRQLRLRDLAGLIVIDFIDMEDHRNDRNVEKRLRDSVRHDRARIQIGKISQFGLLEMSRQRLRAGVIAGSTVPCPHCGGQGIVRSVESTALRVLRALDEEGQRGRTAALTVKVATDVAIYTLNQKRRELARIEHDCGMIITFDAQPDMIAGHFEIERTQQRSPEDRPKPALEQPSPEVIEAAEEAEPPAQSEEEVVEDEEAEEIEDDVRRAPPPSQVGARSGAPSGEAREGGRRRRRRRRGRDHAPAQQGNGSYQQQPQPPQALEPRFDINDGIPDTTPGAYEAAPQQPRLTPEPSSEGLRDDSEAGRRRKRRRRGRRGRRDGEFGSQPQVPRFEGEGVPVDESVREDSGELEETPSLDVDETHPPLDAPIIVPNAPSEPVWSLSSEKAREAIKAEPAKVTPLPEPRQTSKPETPSQPARKGWWQRAFRSD